MQAEAAAVQSAARLVSDCALELWPHCRVLPFGSQATSMALPGSDVDIAILGVGYPAAKGAVGFSKYATPLITALLSSDGAPSSTACCNKLRRIYLLVIMSVTGALH